MKRIRALWALFKDGYLREQGWFRSFVEGRAIDAHGEPVPWMNYAVIDFLKERLRPEMNLLEFGSGGSTLSLRSGARGWCRWRPTGTGMSGSERKCRTMSNCSGG